MAVGPVRSRCVTISEDGLRAAAYFDRPLPRVGRIVFGHGDAVELILPGRLRSVDVVRLDHTRLRRSMPQVAVDNSL